jgi:peptidyl-prolyl cis-trans isomerase SurA
MGRYDKTTLIVLALFCIAGQRPGQKPKAVPDGTQLAGAHILIAYAGASRAKQSVTRTKAQARKLARKLAALAVKRPASFGALARKHSDGPSASRGGDLGTWRKGQMVPSFDAAVVQLRVGQVSGPVETPFGFHVILRKAPAPLLAGAHILIAYKGAKRAKRSVSRTKAQALRLARRVAALAAKDPKQFAALAKKHSDGPSASVGGELGSWTKGRMVPAFDTAVLKLKVGQVSGPVETPFGFHVILRKAP